MFVIINLGKALIQGIIDGFNEDENAATNSQEQEKSQADENLERGKLIEQAMKYPWSMSYYGLDLLLQKDGATLELFQPGSWQCALLGSLGYVFSDKSEAREQYENCKNWLSEKFTGIGKSVYDKNIPIISDFVGGFTGTVADGDVNNFTMAGSFYKGILVDGAGGLVDGVVNVAINPEGTVKGLVSALAHPDETLHLIGHSIGKFVKTADGNDWANIVGQVTFEVATEIATAGAAGAAKGGVKAANGVDNVVDTAHAIENTEDVLQGADHVDDALGVVDDIPSDKGVNIKPEVDEVKPKDVPSTSRKVFDDVKANQTQCDEINKIKDPNTELVDPNHPHNYTQKGNYGEMKVDVDLESTGQYKRISSDRVTDLDTATHHGIDGVYENASPPPKYIISDSKYVADDAYTSPTKAPGLSTTKNNGKQLSDTWVNNNLDSAVDEDIADLIRSEMKQNPSNVQSVVSKVDKNKNVTHYLVDSSGNVMKNADGTPKIWIP